MRKPPWERRPRRVDMTVGVVAVAVIAVLLVGVRQNRPAVSLSAMAAPTTAPTLPEAPKVVLPRPAPKDVPASLPEALTRVPTTDPVVFLTIDDGYVRDPAVLEQIRRAGVPVSLFLVESEARAGARYFADIVASGAAVENHTLTHPDLRGMPLTSQAAEICGSNTLAREVFGVSPKLFRPPFGAFDATTRQAAAQCGFSTMVLWEATVNDGVLRIQGGRERLQAGDVILMHFRPDLSENLAVVFAAMAEAGLGVGRLQDYVRS